MGGGQELKCHIKFNCKSYIFTYSFFYMKKKKKDFHDKGEEISRGLLFFFQGDFSHRSFDFYNLQISIITQTQHETGFLN